MQESLIKSMFIINFFWTMVALALNYYWYKTATELNDKWAEYLDERCTEIEQYYTEGDDKNE